MTITINVHDRYRKVTAISLQCTPLRDNRAEGSQENIKKRGKVKQLVLVVSHTFTLNSVRTPSWALAHFFYIITPLSFHHN